MNTKDENLLVRLIKKAVGLPTASSSCSCGAHEPAASGCCDASATPSAPAQCGCESSGAQQPEQPPAQS